MKINLKTRDEISVIDLDKVAYLQAEGNYTRIVYIQGYEIVLGFGLSKIELIFKQTIKEENYKRLFIRFGRSLILSKNFLTKIDLLKSRVTISDYGQHTYTLDVPKIVAKTYKNNINNGKK
ncbi:MAG: hypothetical protein II878_02440 [Bacteroidales bacterium]|jgi:DNA-binding LytR/AlgR family response regulator|nr:hypothetical protein [Bacteroidales bacterium]